MNYLNQQFLKGFVEQKMCYTKIIMLINLLIECLFMSKAIFFLVFFCFFFFLNLILTDFDLKKRIVLLNNLKN